jgi:hypothetical protein
MKERFERWMQPETRSRRLLLGLGIYVATVVVFSILAGDRILKHTAYNHYALMADAWAHGRHELAGGPPGYAGMNDFALFENKWFISFPPFPALLMFPLVKLAGSPENFRDGQFVVWLAGLGPAVLFLALEKLRRTTRSTRTEIENVRLAILFAFGTVYFFSAVQGTVWFAAHVVGVALAALFVLFALDAERPALAGLMLGFMFLTRPTTALVGVFFLIEAWRASDNGKNREKLVRLLAMSALPVLGCLVFASWLNHARFHTWDPSAFGHEYLQVGWKTRIDRWGLFSFHYLPRNLAVMLGSLPWKPFKGEPEVPLEALGMTFQVPHYVISGHGLALWFTTPFYFWLLRPKNAGLSRGAWAAALAAAVGPLAMNLLYQNSGWSQFGYRFSNDYAVFLFVMLAVSAERLGRRFWICAAWAVALNLFGAMSFERAGFAQFYSHEAAIPTRRYDGSATMDLVYPPD